MVAVKAGILPVPPAPKPIAGLLFVHTKVAPGGTLVKLYGPAVEPAQTVSFPRGIIVGATLVNIRENPLTEPRSAPALSLTLRVHTPLAF